MKKIEATFDLEKELLDKGFDFVIGTDEVGRGPLAGPVVAAAAVPRNLQSVIFNLENPKDPNYELLITNYNLIRDSKKLSEKQRENIFDFIRENFYVGIGICNHETIDRINILEASFLAMKKATQDLQRKINLENPETYSQATKVCILVDGNKKIPNFSMEQLAVIGGDKICKSISAASIIAKVTRDRMMLEAHEKYPLYGFERHKGYGTKIHMEALQKYGPCEIHRKSFAPVRRLASH